MICRNCGAQFPDGSRFCPRCGTPNAMPPQGDCAQTAGTQATAFAPSPYPQQNAGWSATQTTQSSLNSQPYRRETQTVSGIGDRSPMPRQGNENMTQALPQTDWNRASQLPQPWNNGMPPEKKGKGKLVLILALVVLVLAGAAFGAWWFFFRDKEKPEATQDTQAGTVQLFASAVDSGDSAELDKIWVKETYMLAIMKQKLGSEWTDFAEMKSEEEAVRATRDAFVQAKTENLARLRSSDFDATDPKIKNEVTEQEFLGTYSADSVTFTVEDAKTVTVDMKVEIKLILLRIDGAWYILDLEAGKAAKEDENTTGASVTPTTQAVPADNQVCVGFIFLHDENSTYDRNFIEAAKEACNRLGVQCVLKTNIPEDNACYEAAVDLVDRGCSLIFADSFGHEAFLIQAAKDFPDVQFVHASGTRAHTEGLPNYHNAYAASYEGCYLTGVAAGMKLNAMIEDGLIAPDAAKLGYVGTFTYAEVISDYTAFFLGARSICPSATMEVAFTGSWYDESAEKDAAQTLIGNGCVLISQHTGSWGAPMACEAAYVPNVAYSISTMGACPNTALVTCKIDWVPCFEYLIKAVRDNTPIVVDWTGDLSSGSVRVFDLNSAVAAPGTAEKIEEVRRGLMNGMIRVFDTDTFTVNGKALTNWMADVDSDSNFEPDTEAVGDGYFHECEYRSAPCFDVRIDGITLLNESW